MCVRSQEVDARETVHLEIDESGCCDASSRPSAESESGDPATLDRDVARHQAPVDECRLDTQSLVVTRSQLVGRRLRKGLDGHVDDDEQEQQVLEARKGEDPPETSSHLGVGRAAGCDEHADPLRLRREKHHV